MHNKLSVDRAAHAVWDDRTLTAIGLGVATSHAAAETTTYAVPHPFGGREQSVIAAPALDRHFGQLLSEQQAGLTAGTAGLVTLGTKTGDALAQDRDNALVEWI